MIDWTNPGLVGGLLGSAGGLFGGLIGVWGACIGVFANKGTHRDVMIGSGYVFLSLGITSLVAGIVLLINGTMYAIWYPLTLTGFVVTVILAALIPVAKKRYNQAEERLMSAESLRRE